MEGNLLSLPIGDGLLYVQPIYVQATSGTQYPTLQYVLTLFGDSVGFAPTLDESLDEVFGGDSGVEAGDAGVVGEKEAPIDGGEIDPDLVDPDAEPTDEPTAAEPTEDPTTAEPPAPLPGTPEERLDTALQDARTAIMDSNSAMEAGDWAAYGQAQDALSDAIDRAVEAQQELDAN